MSDEPHVRIEVRCRSEDLDFGDGIKPKDKSILSTFKNMINRDVNKAAAEQYLKSVLMKEGLLIAELDHIYGNVTLADVVLTLE